ncbi:MAG: serine--tRNA ligase [bacterium]
MIDLRLIREKPEEVEKNLRKRGKNNRIDEVIILDNEYRRLKTRSDELRNIRNVVSKEIGFMEEGEEKNVKIEEMKKVSLGVKELDLRVKEARERLYEKLSYLPNIPHETVPVSESPDDKLILREWGEKAVKRDRSHIEIAKELGMIDMERGAKISRGNFSLYRGKGAVMEWGLISYMIEVNTREKGYELVLPPYLVNAETMYTSGNLPKFEEQLFRCRDDELYLIPTSEVPLANMHRDEILREEDLPLYYCSYTANFRREAGTHGRDERGLIRTHQFNKVEMFKYTTPESSYGEFDKLVGDAEDLVRRLGLHYRVTLLVTGDMAMQSAKTVDIEVWLPGQGGYYEVSSCSNCEDYQARRGGIRYYPSGGGRPRLVHTLNGSGLATSRLMVAILETYLREDGSVEVPEVLRKYMGGEERIVRAGKGRR